MGDAQPQKEVQISQKKPVNIWMLVSAVLLITILAIILLPKISPGISGKAASSDESAKLVDFINKYLVKNGTATFSSIRDLGDIYEVNVTYNSKVVSVYMSKDGKYYLQGAIDMTNPPKSASAASSGANVPQNVTKSDRPKADAFVFAYCPYGVQFEKALSPVYNLLKGKADINIVFIGAMHGAYEKVESLRQLCILKNYDKDKLFLYIEKFDANTSIGNCKGNDTCLNPLLQDLMSSISIDKAKIDSCMKTDDESLYNQDNSEAKSLGISSSPTFVINGVQVKVSRAPDSIKKAICDAFTKAPSECSQNLSATAASVGFGAGTSAAASSGSGCGA
jgi:hypothetical protein